MRRLFCICATVVFLCGCGGPDIVDDFGKDSTGECLREQVSHGTITIDDNAKFSGDVVLLEQDDPVFTWEEVFLAIQKLRQAYVTKVRKNEQLCSSYLNCQVSQKEWQSYWQKSVHAALRLTEFRRAMVERIGYRLGQRRMSRQQQQIARDLVEHLDRQMGVAQADLLALVGDLETSGVLQTIDGKDTLRLSTNELHAAAIACLEDQKGKAEVSSANLLEQIRQAESDLGMVLVVE